MNQTDHIEKNLKATPHPDSTQDFTIKVQKIEKEEKKKRKKNSKKILRF